MEECEATFFEGAFTLAWLVFYLYFAHGESVAEAVGLELPQVVAGVVLLALLLEGLRLEARPHGLRPAGHEAHQVSALAWGAVGVGFVLLLTPHEAYAWPLIASLALGDPLMGELAERTSQTDR